jgi:hypothetical protein
LATKAGHVAAALGDDFCEIAITQALNFGRAEVSEAKSFSEWGGCAAVNGVTVGTLAFVNAFAGRGLAENDGAEKKYNGERSHDGGEMPGCCKGVRWGGLEVVKWENAQSRVETRNEGGLPE